ncbi:MAG: type II toxin-antitoxin system RelE/ParE family toxin [Methylobacter sp.]
MQKSGFWAMRVNWSEPALEDLESIQAYIAKDSRFYARQFIERILDAATKLEAFPEIGRRVPEAEERDDIWELIFQGYRIIYLLQPKDIFIIAIVHGSRNLTGPW